MPKIEIDYSNTIFYKIFCKDHTIKDVYVGLTTNFVQRKHGHKQSCKHENAPNYNCKLYDAIRKAGGWDNWQMEIIAFHNCNDSYEAHKKEQEYFDKLGATLNSIEPLPKPKITTPTTKVVKEKTILFCKPCNIYFSYWKAQETHNNSQKHHKMVTIYNANQSSIATENSQKLEKKHDLFCHNCHFKCSKYSEWDRHILTRKHEILTNPTNPNKSLQLKTPKVSQIYQCPCGKTYKHRSTLSHHKKDCTDKIIQIEESTPSPDDIQLPTNMIIELIKQNQEFKQLVMDQNKQLLEVMKDCKPSNNNNNNNNNVINSNNKTFNLQVFLNETCKDAMNMKDFIQSLQLNLTDLEKVGELGYAEGISRMFINGLNNLEVTKRPIHCSDVKREIMHIKDEDKWEKYNASQDKLKNIIRQITFKNIMLMDDWKEANPKCTEYNSRKYDHYLKLMLESMGPTDEVAEKRDFSKIIRRVAENTMIDKKYMV
jgi:hypothetical protein